MSCLIHQLGVRQLGGGECLYAEVGTTGGSVRAVPQLAVCSFTIGPERRHDVVREPSSRELLRSRRGSLPGLFCQRGVT